MTIMGTTEGSHAELGYRGCMSARIVQSQQGVIERYKKMHTPNDPLICSVYCLLAFVKVTPLNSETRHPPWLSQPSPHTFQNPHSGARDTQTAFGALCFSHARQTETPSIFVTLQPRPISSRLHPPDANLISQTTRQ